LLSRLYRKAEALDQACLRAQGHPNDYSLRQELLAALEWEEALHPEHVPTILVVVEEVRVQLDELSSCISQTGPDGTAEAMAEIKALRKQLAKLLQVLAARQQGRPQKG
jgi:hypothetical protein